MTTFATLKSDLEAWIARSDLSTRIPAAIRLIEPEINRRVQIHEQETDATLTFTSANSYADDLPTGFLGFKAIYVDGVSDPKASYRSPDAFHQIKSSTDNTLRSSLDEGYPYTFESNKVKVYAPQGSTEDVTFTTVYWKRYDTLSDSNTTHALLQNHYDMYLWGSLKTLWSLVDEEEEVARYDGWFERAIAQVIDHEAGRFIPPAPLVRTPPLRGVF